MRKRKPCGRLLTVKDEEGYRTHPECPYERMKGKQRCEWHWLASQPADVQRAHAEDRRERRLGHDNAVYLARVPSDQWPPGERWCAGCQSLVPLFYTSGSRCKSCASTAAHGSRVEKVYGITAEQYNALHQRQGGRCAICRNKPRTQRLAVDHDHKSGDVRGLLCKRCNHDLLGGARDDVSMLWSAIGYLLFPPATHQQSTVERGHILAALDERLRLRDRLAEPVAPEDPPF